jgi:hypothetical protein
MATRAGFTSRKRPSRVPPVDAVDRAFEDRPVVSFRYLQRRFGPYALGDITDIALNHLGSINRVDIADKLYVNSPPVFGFKRQILVADNPLRLELAKSGLGRQGISLNGPISQSFLPTNSPCV